MVGLLVFSFPRRLPEGLGVRWYSSPLSGLTQTLSPQETLDFELPVPTSFRVALWGVPRSLRSAL